MDLLSQILSSFRTETTLVSRWTLRAPWSIGVFDFRPGYFLTVTKGECWILKASDRPIHLKVGDAIIMAHGSDCVISSSRTPGEPTALTDLPWQGATFDPANPINQPELSSVVDWGGKGEATSILGLAFTFERQTHNTLIQSLPRVITQRRESTELLPLFHPAIEQLTNDTEPGYFAVARQMAELMIIELIRRYALSGGHRQAGWMKGYNDKSLNKALSAIHFQPEHSWSVAELAERCGLSRSAFSARFHQVVGDTPIKYLHQWRIYLACEKLIRSRDSITQIAEQLGYDSDRALRRVFREIMNVSPSTYRRHNTELK